MAKPLVRPSRPVKWGERLLLPLTALVFFVAGTFQFVTIHIPYHAAQPQHKLKAYVGQNISCAGGTTPYVPPASFFGIEGSCRSITASRYDYESNLTCGRSPVADSDYLFSPGIQVYFKLGGPSWLKWHYVGSILIDGSGVVSTWMTPNGGCVAFAHLDGNRMNVRETAHIAPIMSPLGASGTPLSGDEVMGKAVGNLLLPQFNHATMASGGYSSSTKPGLTRWPDWGIYGNGFSGPGNAHLCVIYDALAAQFFINAVSNVYHKPKPVFHLSLFEHYRTTHHLKKLPAYVKGGHKLTWPAAVLRFHHRLGGLKERGRYHKVTHGFSYISYAYEHGHATCWPKIHHCKVVYARK